MTRHTILFLAANPVGTARLDLDEEARAIQLELELSGCRERFEFVCRLAARPMDLLRALRKLRPTVVHFSGHGQGNVAEERMRDDGPQRDVTNLGTEHLVVPGLYFQGPDRCAQFVSATALRETFGAAGSSVRLVVLNACYSDAQAAALAEHVDCVVGIDGAIHDDAARHFAVGFYGGLGESESVAAAYSQGKAAIALEGRDDSRRPRLTVRNGVDASRLVLSPALATPAVPVAAGQGGGSTGTHVLTRAARPSIAIRRATRFALAAGMVVGTAMIAWRIRTEHLRSKAEDLRREARIMLRHLENDDAEARLRQAVALDPDGSLAHADLAVALAARGNYKEAQRAADTAAALPGSLSARDRTWVIGVAAEMRWDLLTAMSAYTVANALSNDGGFETTLRLAHLQTLAGREQEASVSLDRIAAAAAEDDLRVDDEKLRAVATSVPTDDQVGVLNALAKRREKFPRIVAVALWKQCDVFRARSDSRSVETCDRAFGLFAEQRNTLGVARVRSIQATLIARGLGVYEKMPLRERLLKATVRADQAVDIASELKSQIDHAGALQNRASIWQQRVSHDGDNAVVKAGADYNAATKIFKDIGDRLSVARLQNNQGLARLHEWRHAEARDLLREARDTFRSCGANTHAGVAAANLGKAQYLLGELSGAEASLREALEIAAANNIEIYVVDALINLGSVYLARGRVSEARACLQGTWCYPGANHRPTSLGDEGHWEVSLLHYEESCSSAAGATQEASMRHCENVDHMLSLPAAERDYEALAEDSDICARTLLAKAICAFRRHDERAGMSLTRRAHQVASDAAIGTQDDERVGVSLLTTDARALGLLRDVGTARKRLDDAWNKAKAHQLCGLKLDVRLAGVELAYRDMTMPVAERTRLAQALRADAARQEFSLIVNKLDRLAAAP